MRPLPQSPHDGQTCDVTSIWYYPAPYEPRMASLSLFCILAILLLTLMIWRKYRRENDER